MNSNSVESLCMKHMVFIMIVVWAGCGDKESPESSVKTPSIPALAENTPPPLSIQPEEEARNSGVPSTAEVNREKTDVQEAKYKGRVKSVKESILITRLGSNGKPVKKGYVRTFTQYNQNGYLAEHVFYYEGNMQTREVPEHDDKWYLIKMHKHRPDGASAGRHEFEYNKKGERIEMITYNFRGKESTRSKFRYTDNGKLTEQVITGQSVFAGKFEWKYDVRGNKTEYIRVRDGKTTYKETYKHDEQGNILEKVIFDDGEKEDATYTYMYNGNGKLIKCSQSWSGGGSFVREYNKNGDVFRTMYTRPSKPTEFLMTTHKYDERGNKVKEIKELPSLFGRKKLNGKPFVEIEETSWEFTYWD